LLFGGDTQIQGDGHEGRPISHSGGAGKQVDCGVIATGAVRSWP
jgi:hypothetical protein